MIIYRVLFFAITITVCRLQQPDKICFSPENESSDISGKGQNHETALNYLKRFSNCTTIVGNLVIMNIDDRTGEHTKFLHSIRKITGFVAISNCNFTSLPLPNLTIVSGQNLLKVAGDPKLAIFVSYIEGASHIGLNSLKEVTNGDVMIENNALKLTGYALNINWDDIIMSGKRFIKLAEKHEPLYYKNDYPCHGGCSYPDRCWGPLKESCQALSMVICEGKCPAARCYFREEIKEPLCCHRECAGGCTGTSSQDCLGCRNFNATGECVKQCPTPYIYDKASYSTVPNPDVLYSLGNECLKKCPEPYLTEEGNCVKKCSSNLMVEEDTSKCIPCPPEGCPKRCPGFSSTKDLKKLIKRCSDRIRGRNCSKAFVNFYSNCTIIEGSINIDKNFNVSFESTDALEALHQVEEVTGYVSILTNHMFTDFGFLRNLKKIKGMKLKQSHSCEGGGSSDGCKKYITLEAALHIQALQDKKFQELRLNSLEKIDTGIVIIMASGSPLCYLPDKRSFSQIMNITDDKIDTSVLIKYNDSYCGAVKKLCDAECVGGCWGPGPSNCFKCSKFTFEGKCVDSCKSKEIQGIAVYEAEDKVCKRCHEQCDPSDSCTGPGNDECKKCKTFKDGPRCVAECPHIKFANESGDCQYCNENCIVDMGCTGSGDHIGAGGCNFCNVVRLLEEAHVTNGKRIGQCDTKCERGMFPNSQKPITGLPTHELENPDDRVKVCTPCAEECSECAYPGVEAYHCKCRYAEDGGVCVKACPKNKFRSLRSKQCLPCDTTPCPKNCESSDTEPLSLTTITRLFNCELIEGSVVINSVSWNGPDPINSTHLEYLNEIVTITGRLVIRDSPDPEFTSLSMFTKLTAVKGLHHGGHRKRAPEFALQVENNTALETADFIRLKNVGGPIKLAGDNLCYVDKINWSEALETETDVNVDVSAEKCANKTCSDQCSSGGCYGGRNNMCVSCKNKEFNGGCFASCEDTYTGSYDDNTPVCKPCHHNCITCTGKENHMCIKCRYVMDRNACLLSCISTGTYKDYVDGEAVCKPCNDACKIGENSGCTGNGTFLGEGGCNACKMHDRTGNTEYHLSDRQCIRECPDKSYKLIEDQGNEEYKSACIPCHPQCTECTNEQNYDCKSCLNVKQSNYCKEKCDDGFYPDDENICQKCSDACASCLGPGTENCTQCRSSYFSLPTKNVSMVTKICVFDCPDKYGFYTHDGDDNKVCAESCDESNIIRDKSYCSHIAGRTSSGKDTNNVLPIVLGVSCLVIFIGILLFLWKKLRRKQKKRHNLLKHNQKTDDKINNPIYEPVQMEDFNYPTDQELLLVTEDSLQIGDVLGSGAFGKVYKGKWNLSETHKDIPVAIKILKDSGDAESTKDFFDEAVVMGKLDHKHLVRILGLCSGKNLMLVTQLMPLGSLLDYVRKFKNSLTAHQLLTYGAHIANGMAYLECHNVVHRDLAARNVLVQTPTFVKITDFGLAKMLSRKQDTFTSEGGKLPIKWLAIESLKYRHFTSRSDVWSYGVTLWEVLEFGNLPWRTKPPTELIASLEVGERLPRPKICTLEVYALMLRCWVDEPTARPNFEDLMGSMNDFLKEPNRYLHINHRASTEGSFLSPHPSITSEYRDSGVCDVDRNYENDDKALAMERALYHATSSLRHAENPPQYDPALTTDQDDVFSDSPSTARNSVIDTTQHDYVQDYLVPDQVSIDEGNGTDSSQDQGYVKMNGDNGQYADLESNVEYTNTDDLSEPTQSLLNHHGNHGNSINPLSNKSNKSKFLANRNNSPLIKRKPQQSPILHHPNSRRPRDDGYSSLRDPHTATATTPLTRTTES